MNYYNEFDPFASAWLGKLRDEGHIPPGTIDARDMREVQPADLSTYTQAHFFAGIGGWSHALTLAGWPLDRTVWTGSCPCQPFSSAGKRKGNADARHLWPDWFRLIRERRPDTIFGEQVEGAIRLGWLDGVFADLEGEGYTCGAAVLGAHSVGAPHIRQRLFWVAHTGRGGVQRGLRSSETCGTGGAHEHPGIHRRDSRVAHLPGPRLEGCDRGTVGHELPTAQRGGGPGGVEHTPSNGREPRRPEPNGRGVASGRGPWDHFGLIPSRDGKARRIEPGSSPLAHGVSNRVVRGCDPSEPINAVATGEARVGRLRGYGNAIVPAVAAEFVAAFLDVEGRA